MRIIFMGTPDFAVPSLQALHDAQYEVVGVFCQPDKPVGRKQIITPPAVKVLAMQLGYKIYQPKTLKDPEIIALIKDLAPDLIVVAAYGKMLPKEILEVPRFGCLNLHGSILPKYRGAAPIQWAVYNGETETGITMMQMNEGMDTGDILCCIRTEIESDETAGELFDRLSLLGAKHLDQTIQKLATLGFQPIKQEESLATYAPMIKKEDALIDWNRSALEIYNQVRAFQPWPVAYTFLNEKQFKIYSCAPIDGYFGVPATMIQKGNELIVCCGQNTAVALCEIQLEGSKRMATELFLRGHQFPTNTMLSNQR